MKQKVLVLLAVVLTVCIALTGCANLNFPGYFAHLSYLLGGGGLTPFDQMTYTRPDMTAFAAKAEQCCAAAEKETDLEKMVQIIYDLYGAYDDFYTNYAMAMICYSKDQTDASWESEYNFCTGNAAQVSAAMDRFYRILAKSPLRKQLEADQYFGRDFFAEYEGETIYDAYFTELLDAEAELENQYYSLIAQAGEDYGYTQSFYDAYGSQMAQIFVELIRNRQAQAEHAGYDNYPEFAYGFYHMRDYTPAQAVAYLADIRAELVPLYKTLLQDPGVTLYTSNQSQTFAYVQSMAQAMGGEISQAFLDMEKAGLYDISASENKLNASFEIYLRNYRSPYVFLNASGTQRDHLTFAHEFGHFCSDYMSFGSGAGVDVSEVFSQGMEYLSLCYGPADENLQKLKMFDSLCIFVEQAAYASFEHQVYGLEGENLTVDRVQALFDSVCDGYGLEGDWRYVFITHLFTEPMYVISYTVSNDAALQLYQMEMAKAGSGLACLRENMTTRQGYFLAFLKEAGLQSPFTPGRITQVKETLQSVLNG